MNAPAPTSLVITQSTNCATVTCDGHTVEAECTACCAGSGFVYGGGACTRRPVQNRTALLAAVDAWLLGGDSQAGVQGQYGQAMGDWDVSRVTDFSKVFSKERKSANENFNEDIGAWDTSNAVTMNQMFNRNKAFNQAIGQWDVSNVQDMGSMF